jgi:hypothetical protein
MRLPHESHHLPAPVITVAAAAPFLSGERLWALVVLGIALILAVCWLACRMKDDDIEIPILSVRRGKSKKLSKKDSGKGEEKDGKGDANAS